MLEKLWFSLKDSGVGGSFVVVPMASSGVGGEVGRRVSRCPASERLSGKTYCSRCWLVSNRADKTD